jgi:hypothetical protein
MAIGIKSNQRKESRYYFGSGNRLGWRGRGKRGPRRKGWLYNVSNGGLSFFVEAPRAPKAGDALEIARKGEPSPGLWRVVHLAPCDGDLYLVGCQRVTANEKTPVAA